MHLKIISSHYSSHQEKKSIHFGHLATVIHGRMGGLYEAEQAIPSVIKMGRDGREYWTSEPIPEEIVPIVDDLNHQCFLWENVHVHPWHQITLDSAVVYQPAHSKPLNKMG